MSTNREHIGAQTTTTTDNQQVETKTMPNITLTPAYGRDYKSKAAVQADFDAGKDFLIAQFGHPYDGKPANKADLTGETVNVRYSQLRKITNVQP